MTSSAFSFDNFDELLSSFTQQPPTETTPTAGTLSDTSSGESPAVFLSGLASTGGGASKKYALWIPACAGDKTFCLGCINQHKFCTKMVSDSTAKGCGVLAHRAKKFTVASSAGYVQETESRAWCIPAFDIGLLSPAQLLRIQGAYLSIKDWEALFHDLEQHIIPKWLAFTDSNSIGAKEQLITTDLPAPNGSTLLSPFAHEQSGGLLALVPSLSFDESTASSGDDSEGEPNTQSLSRSISHLRSNFASLQSKWKRAFTEVEAGYGLLVQDLQRVHQFAQSLRTTIGSPVTVNGSIPSSVWGGVALVHEQVSTAIQDYTTHFTFLGNQQDSLTQVIHTVEQSTEDVATTLTSKLSAVELDLRHLEQRFLKLVPVLHQLKRGGSNVSAHTTAGSDITQFDTRFKEIELSVKSLREIVLDQMDINANNVSPGDQLPQIRELQAQMKQLQLRVVGKGVQIANKVFQSFDDVHVWVTTHLPIRRYGLFVDGVSIFEFFTYGHVDAEATYSSFYSQHRTGFASSYEARVASSIQNLFPAVFGKSDSNVDTAESLPALSTPEKWDSNDGNTGLRYQITRNMADVELQISESISTILKDYPEAQYIARECLHQAKRFALELAQFITLDYQKWKHRGHAKRDAWKMTAVCVRRIFEELYSERVIARDIYDQKDPDFTTAKYLWATWKAHGVMERYLRHQFYEHPSISAVLARHLADNYVKPDDSQAAKIKALEAAVKTLQSRYDSLRLDQDKDKSAKNGKGKLVIGSG